MPPAARRAAEGSAAGLRFGPGPRGRGGPPPGPNRSGGGPVASGAARWAAASSPGPPATPRRTSRNSQPEPPRHSSPQTTVVWSSPPEVTGRAVTGRSFSTSHSVNCSEPLAPKGAPSAETARTTRRTAAGSSPGRSSTASMTPSRCRRLGSLRTPPESSPARSGPTTSRSAASSPRASSSSTLVCTSAGPRCPPRPSGRGDQWTAARTTGGRTGRICPASYTCFIPKILPAAACRKQS